MGGPGLAARAGRLAPRPARPAASPDVAVPSAADPVVARATGAIGGPWGRHAGAGRWWTPLRVLLAMTCFTLLLGFAQKSPCTSADWVNDKQYTHMCYSDIVPLWADERLNVGAVPYRDTAVEYPVLTGAFMWLTADLTRGVLALDSHVSDIVVFGVLSALLLSLCALVTTGATVGASGRRPYDVAIFALSPVLVVHAFTNWDLFAMAFASGALWAWARRKPVLTGALIGLGTAAKLYPVFLLLALGILAVRTRRYASVLWATFAAGLVWAMVNVPVAFAYYPGWSRFYTFSFDRPAERSTFWAILRALFSGSVRSTDAPYWVPPGPAVAFLLVGALVAVVWVGLQAPVKPRLGQLAFLAVLAFLLTTKVWSPQYSLWLVPLVALARPRWRLSLLWQFSEVAVWLLTLTLLLGFDPARVDHSIAYGWLIVALVVRDILLIAIAVLVVIEMWHPERDVVRRDGVDDPAGGEFDGATDYPPVGRVAALRK